MINATDANNTFYVLNIKKEIPIVFIHGVGLNHSIWDPQINAFENTTLIYDILGHGKTPLNKIKVTFDDFADQLKHLIDELKFDKIHLVGFSIGSLIARNFATRYNDKLNSLTLLCSVFKRTKEQQQLVNDRFNLAKKSNSLSKKALNRWFNEKFLNENENIYDLISGILKNNNMQNFLKVYELFVNHQDNEDFQKINTKTLVMTGENDIGSTPEMSRKLNKIIKDSKLYIIPKGKHLCSIECADDVNNAIKDHINE